MVHSVCAEHKPCWACSLGWKVQLAWCAHVLSVIGCVFTVLHMYRIVTASCAVLCCIVMCCAGRIQAHQQ